MRHVVTPVKNPGRGDSPRGHPPGTTPQDPGRVGTSKRGGVGAAVLAQAVVAEGVSALPTLLERFSFPDPQDLDPVVLPFRPPDTHEPGIASVLPPALCDEFL